MLLFKNKYVSDQELKDFHIYVNTFLRTSIFIQCHRDGVFEQQTDTHTKSSHFFLCICFQNVSDCM